MASKKRVAVEGPLSNVGMFLEGKGYEVVSLDPHTQTGIELKNCDAVVISGMDRNLMGYSNIKTASPVIEANGLTPEQVYRQIKNRIGEGSELPYRIQ